MANGKGQGGPAASKPKLPRNTALDRELASLERQKMVATAGGQICLTRDGYRELVRRGLVRS